MFESILHRIVANWCHVGGAYVALTHNTVKHDFKCEHFGWVDLGLPQGDTVYRHGPGCLVT